MIVNFWYVDWETCIIPIPKTVWIFIEPFSFSVSIKITKHCSSPIWFIFAFKNSFWQFLCFPLYKKNIFDRWSYVTFQKNPLTRGYTLPKNARQYDQNCVSRSDLESINGSKTPCTTTKVHKNLVHIFLTQQKMQLQEILASGLLWAKLCMTKRFSKFYV